jgi:hypothetical protein
MKNLLFLLLMLVSISFGQNHDGIINQMLYFLNKPIPANAKRTNENSFEIKQSGQEFSLASYSRNRIVDGVSVTYSAYSMEEYEILNEFRLSYYDYFEKNGWKYLDNPTRYGYPSGSNIYIKGQVNCWLTWNGYGYAYFFSIECSTKL